MFYLPLYSTIKWLSYFTNAPLARFLWGEVWVLLRCDLMREGVLLDAASIPLEANGQTSWLIDQAFPAADTSDFGKATARRRQPDIVEQAGRP